MRSLSNPGQEGGISSEIIRKYLYYDFLAEGKGLSYYYLLYVPPIFVLIPPDSWHAMLIHALITLIIVAVSVHYLIAMRISLYIKHSSQYIEVMETYTEYWGEPSDEPIGLFKFISGSIKGLVGDMGYIHRRGLLASKTGEQSEVIKIYIVAAIMIFASFFVLEANIGFSFENSFGLVHQTGFCWYLLFILILSSGPFRYFFAKQYLRYDPFGLIKSRSFTFALVFLFTITSTAWGEGLDSARVKVPEGQATVGTDEAHLSAQLAGSGARAQWYSDEIPQRKVKVAEFFIDKTEVTNQRFKTMFADHLFPPNLADHPVVNVTWAKADEFCAKAGGKLPTEEQWERAARGDDGRVYPWGNEFDPEKAMFMGSTGVSRLKVGSFALEQTGENLTGGAMPAGSRPQGASPFGALNMAGNVWEWQAGWYDEKKKLRLLKGGSWLTPRPSLRSAARLGDDGARLFNDYGFRCVYPSAR